MAYAEHCAIADCQDSYRLSRQLHPVKTIADYQDSCRLSRQLQTVMATADSGLLSAQLKTVMDMSVQCDDYSAIN